MRWLLIAAALADVGCFSPSLSALDCGEEGLCPSGFVCDLSTNRCRAPGTGDDEIDGGVLNDDLDDDGVLNDVDNCPDTANAEQWDEDEDDVGDACDNCPADANADQADVNETTTGADSDGVGDACDPNPTLPGDSIAFFDGFNLAPDSRWSTLAGTFTIIDGRLVSGSTSIEAIAVGLGIESGTIRSRARINSLAGESMVGVIAGADTSGAIFCGFLQRLDMEPPAASFGLYELSATNREVIVVGPRPPVEVGAELTQSLEFSGQFGACSDGDRIFGSDDLKPEPSSGGLGLATVSTAAAFAHVIVYKTE